MEYPDGDGVVVWVSEVQQGEYEVSDLGEGDARLVGCGPGTKAIGPIAAGIARRFDVSYAEGPIAARCGVDALPEIAWRVAQASAVVAEAVTFHKPQVPKEAAFIDMVAQGMRSQHAAVETDRQLSGASGHEYTASIYLPVGETVIEPITADRAWNKAAAVYVQFGDLARANGYQLVSVLDNRDGHVAEDVEELLGQVSFVAEWTRFSEWSRTIADGRLP
ncbi:hypothetical protein LRS13_08185 [Svornostia abyssi]|uniref:Uncharacterized protein n=1 Tax=Svornostia abyssi TaxID=2898438 RepID=A0ABY5PLC0_9ACTN|nr:hypothetical protein LRS13_08185 [Parviterribacteraceae bacterium J379]